MEKGQSQSVFLTGSIASVAQLQAGQLSIAQVLCGLQKKLNLEAQSAPDPASEAASATQEPIDGNSTCKPWTKSLEALLQFQDCLLDYCQVTVNVSPSI